MFWATILKNQRQEICKFYKSSNCKHGRSGKKLDYNGKAYAFSHPPLCKKFEMHGYKKERCKNRKCDKLHLNLCKIYMRHYSCKFGAKCKFHHPKELNQNDSTNYTDHAHKQNEEKISYAKIVAKNLEPQVQGLFSNQMPPIQTNYNAQEPFLGQSNPIQQPFLGSQNTQKQIMDLLLTLNQRMTNLEKVKIQMWSKVEYQNV